MMMMPPVVVIVPMAIKLLLILALCAQFCDGMAPKKRDKKTKGESSRSSTQSQPMGGQQITTINWGGIPVPMGGAGGSAFQPYNRGTNTSGSQPMGGQQSSTTSGNFPVLESSSRYLPPSQQTWSQPMDGQQSSTTNWGGGTVPNQPWLLLNPTSSSTNFGQSGSGSQSMGGQQSSTTNWVGGTVPNQPWLLLNPTSSSTRFGHSGSGSQPMGGQQSSTTHWGHGTPSSNWSSGIGAASTSRTMGFGEAGTSRTSAPRVLPPVPMFNESTGRRRPQSRTFYVRNAAGTSGGASSTTTMFNGQPVYNDGSDEFLNAVHRETGGPFPAPNVSGPPTTATINGQQVTVFYEGSAELIDYVRRMTGSRGGQ